MGRGKLSRIVISLKIIIIMIMIIIIIDPNSPNRSRRPRKVIHPRGFQPFQVMQFKSFLGVVHTKVIVALGAPRR